MVYIPSMSPQAIAERQTWQYKTLAYCHANQSEQGALLVAILGRHVNPPCFHVGGCKITADGHVRALYRGSSIENWRVKDLGTVEEFTVKWRALAELCRLDDAQKEAMFAEIRRFVKEDARAKSPEETFKL